MENVFTKMEASKILQMLIKILREKVELTTDVKVVIEELAEMADLILLSSQYEEDEITAKLKELRSEIEDYNKNEIMSFLQLVLEV